MIKTIVLVVLSAFSLGGVGFYIASRHQEKSVARERWTKYRVYLGIVTIVLLAAPSVRIVVA